MRAVSQIAGGIIVLASAAAASLLPHLAAQAPPRTQTPNQTPAQAAAKAETRPPVTVGSQGPLPTHAAFTPQQIEGGGALFQQNCAFCHGRDAAGGESGPDLTRSKLVASDKDGEAIGNVVRNGRMEKGMPRFNLPEAEIMQLVAFVHSQQDKAMSQSGDRRGVEESDLHTGDAAEGKQFFNGAGGCAACHSPEKDLAGVATKFTGLRLEEQMLYPRDVKKSQVSVTNRTGQTITGTIAYQDEFTVALTDSFGQYHSWPKDAVKYTVEDPLKGHQELLSKYTDSDVHNLLAYMQTLK